MKEKTQFDYNEERVAAAVGLSRGDFKFLRDQHLKEGVDWQKRNGSIALTLTAIKKVWRALESPPHTLDIANCTFAAAAEKKTPAPILVGSRAMPLPIKMTVAQIPPNPFILIATDEHGTRCHVRVKSNLNFVVGMQFEAAHDEVAHGYYRQLGNPPRQRGRW